MRDQIYSGLVALLLGAVACVLLFIPYVAYLYRKRGRPTFGALLTGALAVVYGWAIWTYTLLPLPQGPIENCAPVNLDPLVAVDDIRDAFSAGGIVFFDPAVLQLELNVLLFIPLGVFARVLFGRGIVFTTLVGLAVSLLIETTQVTGVWGIYECAYRVFDVDDLITNTLGAFLGSVLSLVVPKTLLLYRRKADADAPRPVTRTRRLLAMTCDLLALVIVSYSISVIARAAGSALLGSEVMLRNAAIIDGAASAVAVTLAFIFIVVTGQSIGDATVRVRYAGGVLPEALARILRFVGGVGAITMLGWIPQVGQLVALGAVVLAIVLVFTTAEGRGLPGVLSGRILADARDQRGSAGERAALPNQTETATESVDAPRSEDQR